MITYENVFSRVINGIIAIVQGEWATLPIHYDSDYELEAHEPQFLNITPISDVLIGMSANGQTRKYVTKLSYLRRIGGGYQKHTHIDTMSDFSEHLKRLLFNNKNYSSDGSYQWHDGRVESVNFITETIEDYNQIDLTFAVIIHEVI